MEVQNERKCLTRDGTLAGERLRLDCDRDGLKVAEEIKAEQDFGIVKDEDRGDETHYT